TSPSLQKEAVQRAMRLAQSCNFFTAINHRGLVLSGLSFGLLLVAGLALLAWVSESRTALARFTDPFGDHPWQPVGTRTAIAVLEHPRNLAIGQSLKISGKIRGKMPDPRKVVIEFEDISMPARLLDIKGDDPGTFLAKDIKIPTHSREVRFRV